MNFRHLAATLALFAAANGSAHAQQTPRALPAVQAVQIVLACQSPQRLPTQAQVGEWTGQHNFGQVYATRTRLVADIQRACRRPGIEQVQLVLVPHGMQTPGLREMTRVAVASN